jgi:hypothetical protein
MKSLMLASAMALVLAAPTFAQTVQGNYNFETTQSTSGVGVQSIEGTSAKVNSGEGGPGAVAGMVSGNYTNIGSSSYAAATPGSTHTGVNTTQVNVGGSLGGAGSAGDAVGTANGFQTSTDVGGGTATASSVNNNFSVTQYGHHH